MEKTAFTNLHMPLFQKSLVSIGASAKLRGSLGAKTDQLGFKLLVQ